LCNKIKTEKWREKNHDHWLDYCKQKNATTPYKEKKKKYYYEEGGKELQAAREKRPDVKLYRKTFHAQYEKTDKVKKYREEYRRRAYCRERANANARKPDAKRKRSEWGKTYRKENISYKLHGVISTQIRQSIAKNWTGWTDVLPYSATQLKNHLERQFDKRMTWKNYGRMGWHIDHIIPKKLFDIKEMGDSEFLACWALSNLRPLWRKENLEKRDKRTYLL